MKSVLLIVFGVAIGFAVAHRINETSKGRQFFSDLDHKARDFGWAVSDGYRRREAELRSAIGEPDGAV